MTSDVSTPLPPSSAAVPPSPPAAGQRRGGRVVGTALLVGALAGAAAGVGGAAVMTNDTAQTIRSRPSAAPTLQAAAPSGQTTTAGSTEAAAANVLPSVVKIYATSPQGSGSGSGIILTGDGEILTNNHVIELAADGGKIAVSFDDGTSANATIIGRDPLTDLAVIKASDVSGLKPATMGTSGDLQ